MVFGRSAHEINFVVELFMLFLAFRKTVSYPVETLVVQ